MNRPPTLSSKQKGVVLLILSSILIMVGATVFFTVSNNTRIETSQQQYYDYQTRKALSQAKEALLGFAATSYDKYDSVHFGLLPCPNLSASPGEGTADGTCGITDESALGRFPWRTLGLLPLKDGADECLWYAVSGYYKSGSTNRTNVLNEDTHGLFRVFEYDNNTPTTPRQLTGDPGSEAATRAVAVIIAPGKALLGQDRSDATSGVNFCGGNYIASNYLELEDNSDINNRLIKTDEDNNVSNRIDKIYEFITTNTPNKVFGADAGTNKNGLNDFITYITTEDIYNIIQQHPDYKSLSNVAEKLAHCLLTYTQSHLEPSPADPNNPGVDTTDKRLPWPAPLELTDYRNDTEYLDTVSISTEALIFGRFPFTLSSSYTDYPASPTLPLDNLNDPLKTKDSFDDLTTDCGNLTAENLKTWNHWKDHVFYAVADTHKPNAAVPSTCEYDKAGGGSRCINVNQKERIVGIVLFSGATQEGQVRNAPPPSADIDTKKDIINYLEYQIKDRVYTGSDSITYTVTDRAYESEAGSNDILWCLQKNDADDDLTVINCTPP